MNCILVLQTEFSKTICGQLFIQNGIFSWEGEMLMCATGACTHRCTHLEFTDFNEILDIFKDKKRQIQL